MPSTIPEISDRFAALAEQFCTIFDDAPTMDRSDFLAQIYRLLPRLIAEAVSLPETERADPQGEPKNLAADRKSRFGDWEPTTSLKEGSATGTLIGRQRRTARQCMEHWRTILLIFIAI